MKQVLVLVLVLGFGLSAAPGSAQTFTSSVSGIVSDQQGAVLPGASVQVRNTATDERRDATTNTDGRYTFSQLLPGVYDVQAELTGFKTFRQVALTLAANQPVELNIRMEIGAVAETVEVTAPPVILNTQSANQSTTLTSQLVQTLPLNARSPFSFVLGLAGTTALTARNFNNGGMLDQQFSRFALNGGRDMSNLILIDGAAATAGDWGGLMVSPSVESVQEIQVVRNSYDSEFGRSGGGVVNVVTRGGSSQFRASGWEFFRGDNFDANTWANNRAGRGKSDFKRHQFGGNVGGPLWQSKRLFFYGSYDALREKVPFSTGFQRVPTERERRGDFSQSFNPNGTPIVIFNPFTTRADPSNPGVFIRDPFPGNVIPANLIDPVAQKLLTLYPLPNRPGEGPQQASNFFAEGPRKTWRDETDIRVDWARSEKHTLYVRYSGAPRLRDSAPQVIGNGLDTAPINNNPRFHATISNTFIPSSSWVINVLVGGGRWKEEQVSPSLGILDATAFGLSRDLFHAPVTPQFNIGGYMTVGNRQIRQFPRSTYTLQVNATKELSRHSLKFGFWGESNLINNVDRFSGAFNFGRGMTSGPTAAADSTVTGHSVASLLLGTGAGGDSPFRADMAASLRYYAGYIQDVWRVNSRLTVNAGVRYEIQRPATERFNRVAWFDPNVSHPLGQQVGLPLKGGFVFATEDDRGQWKQDWNDLAPRVSVVYKWTDKLISRAGYGVFYAASSALYTFDPVPGVSVSTPWVAANGFFPADLLRNPYPQGVVKATGTSAGLNTELGLNPNQVWLREPHPTGHKHMYSFDFQYELNSRTAIEVGYSGFQGRDMVFGQPSSYNQLPTGELARGAALNEQVPNPFFGIITAGNLRFATVPRQRLLRPYPHFDSISITRSLPGAEATFNALNLKLTRHFSDGLAAIVTYQFSRNVDNASEDQGWSINDQWRDTYNKDLEKSISAHDVPHSFAASLLYELPFGRGRKLATSMPAAAEAVLGGWRLSSIVRFSSGFPAAMRAPNPLGQYGFFVARPNLTGDPSIDDPQPIPGNWFNTGAFSNPANFTIGNSPRYLGDLREQAFRNVDLSIAKTFRARAYGFELRADVMNVFNTTQFGGLDTFFGGANFGRATAAINTPRQMQIGVKASF